MQFPFVIKLHRSRLLFTILCLFHTLAIGCVIALPWPWLLRGLLSGLIGLSLANTLRPVRIVGLHLSARNSLDAQLADGNRATLTIKPDSTVFNRLIVLRLNIDEEKRVSTLVLLPDQMPDEQFRLLRICLRWRADSNERAGTTF